MKTWRDISWPAPKRKERPYPFLAVPVFWFVAKSYLPYANACDTFSGRNRNWEAAMLKLVHCRIYPGWASIPGYDNVVPVTSVCMYIERACLFCSLLFCKPA